MKYIKTKLLTKMPRLKKTHSKQNDLLDFLHDKENFEKAAEGSMQKRIDLIDRVNLRKQNV